MHQKQTLALKLSYMDGPLTKQFILKEQFHFAKTNFVLSYISEGYRFMVFQLISKVILTPPITFFGQTFLHNLQDLTGKTELRLILLVAP